MRHLTKTFVGGRALDQVDLTVEAGQVHALLGGNGSGKSTLIKIVSGYHHADDGGDVLIGGQPLVQGTPHSSYVLGARFVHQDLGLIEESSISDNLAFGPGFPTRWGTVREKAARERAVEALALMDLDVSPSTKVGKLSPAQKTGVAVARALLPDPHSPARLLVLDEPTARLPESEVEALLAIVRSVASRGLGVLYVTHRLAEVFQVADRATVLRDGVRVADERVGGLTHARLLEQLFGEELTRPHPHVGAAPGASVVLSARDVRSEALHGVSLQVRAGEVVGVAGITSSGRESLCATLFGARPRDGGEVVVDGRPLRAGRPTEAIQAGVAYVPAERKLTGCLVDLPAKENISIANLRDVWSFPMLRRSRETELAATWFARLGVRPVRSVAAPMSSFSGGNQQKIVYGKWFQRKPSLFLLDEPTQGVDVGAKAELHTALREAAEQGAAVLVTSTDDDELVSLCDRVIVLSQGRQVAELVGSQITAAALTRAALGDDTVLTAEQAPTADPAPRTHPVPTTTRTPPATEGDTAP